MNLGKGDKYTVTSKQILSTKSSTEAEMLTIVDMMAHVLGTRHFLVAERI